MVASLFTPASNTGDAAGDTYTTVENLTGSGFNDTLTGDANAQCARWRRRQRHPGRRRGGRYADRRRGHAIRRAIRIAPLALVASLATPASNTGDAAGDTYSGIENLTGGVRRRSLTGDGDANAIDGGAGNDMLIGGAGADTLIGGAGTDTASYATAAAGVTANLAAPASNTGDAAGDTSRRSRTSPAAPSTTR